MVALYLNGEYNDKYWKNAADGVKICQGIVDE